MRTKSCYGVIAAIVIGLAFSTADTSAANIGFKAGVAVASQKWTHADPRYDSSLDWRTGLTLGLFADQSIMPHFALRGEILYVAKGFKDEVNLTETLHYRIDYLTLNALVKGSLSSGTYALIGPRLDIQLSTASNLEDQGMSTIESKYTKTVFGFTLGMGQELRILPRASLFVEGQYCLDFTKVYNHKAQPGDKITTLESTKNRSISITTGLKF